ncbi:sugar ABC transporter substrate-binding protein [Nocardiopsis composta]|uniref:Arabinogalactan oligomer/maltooligosaccharide transport system substrate-binding protein n=1 Tax=Nocardiopsis composta TaxID=157465 RepID=A0A7W8VD66_9ACTN|nr:maltose ABC transporter substrate-binding protein [Nocardiopsis composta]MBB5432161.1 arabinogalactan oligomer/maltooligosaccharide transport system substrate-binding protein [Nocardiopsis composta]
MRLHTPGVTPSSLPWRVGAPAGAVALLLAAAACGGGGDAETAGQGSLTIWSDPERAEVLEPFAAEFGEANGVEVKVEALPADDLQGDFVTAHGAGSGPDIVVGAHDWIGNLVQNGAIDPVRLPEGAEAGYDPAAIDAVTYQDQVYGVPYAMESLLLLRNTELAPDAPATMEELVETGKALQEDGKAKEALALQVGQTGDPFHLQPLYTSAGGYLFGTDDDGDPDPSDLGVGTDASVEAMERIAGLGEKGEGVLKRSIDADNAPSLFEGGDVPYYVTGPWALAGAEDAGIDYAVSPVPGFEGAGQAAPFLGVQAFFVAAGGENKVLAEEFVVNGVGAPELASALYEADPRPPALIEVSETYQESDPDLAAMREAAEQAVPMPVIPEMSAVWDPFGKAQAAVIGGEDPASAVAAAEKAVSEQIG